MRSSAGGAGTGGLERRSRFIPPPSPISGDPSTQQCLWKYTEEVLLQHHSWKDPETVRRFYSGINDQTLAQAMAIHGWASDPFTLRP